VNYYRLVLESAGLDEAELAAFCRSKGLFPEQLVHQ